MKVATMTQGPIGNLHEQEANSVIAEWLDGAGHGWQADAERTGAIVGSNDRPDIIIRQGDRMPVIVDPPDFERWLGLEAAADDALHALLAPREIAGFRPYRVSDRVNKVQNNDPAVPEPLAA